MNIYMNVCQIPTSPPPPPLSIGYHGNKQAGGFCHLGCVFSSLQVSSSTKMYFSNLTICTLHVRKSDHISLSPPSLYLINDTLELCQIIFSDSTYIIQYVTVKNNMKLLLSVIVEIWPGRLRDCWSDLRTFRVHMVR